MNSEINKKTPAFIYAKEFKLSKVLGNLQAYKLATGDVGQTEQEEASRKHGNNLGALYGDLITKASHENTKRKQDETHDQGSAKRKKRKGRRKQKKKQDGGDQYPVPTVALEDLKEPLPLPECWQKDEDGSSSPKEESSESSDNETVDFLGLASAQKDESSSDDSCTKVDTEISTSRNMRNKSFHKETSSQSERVYDHKTALTTYSCARCNRRGHLTDHCTIPQTAMENYHQPSVKNVSHRSADVQDLFLQCRQLKRSKNVSCSDCGNTSNLAFCFECRLTLCDGRGHLIEHLLNFPTHTKLFSHKLQKLLKCSNSSCNVVNINELLVCPQCLSKIFDKQYSLINATWSNRGLQAITNVLCCEEHFHWHRMNCYSSSAEFLFSRENLLKLQQQGDGLLSEFFF
ncbi:Hypothetical predicted protein [Paramuricea clavata]|uniref:Uncharacterized protein n=1 Tax=Paramuricea clavata TaxID=317549 RepID=A0A7D9IGQ5_PARCT|nr:Hypothetical predicted protein [Paramuricea clavata]